MVDSSSQLVYVLSYIIVLTVYTSHIGCCSIFVFSFICVFFKQKTAYEMRISDWSSDVCSSDLSTSISVWQRLTSARHTGCDVHSHPAPRHDPGQIGRASCRERVCQYV